MDFANILFGGPCNRACPFCIGQSLPERVRASNLNLYPPRNLDAFIDEVNREGVRHIVFTGTTTDPQLYRHEARLLETLRARIVTHADYSLHSNGVLALKKRDTLLLYDKVCLSFPSFVPSTYGKMMGVSRPPDLGAIAALLGARLKVSCVVNEHNAAEVPDFLKSCQELGIARVVLRFLFGDPRRWELLPGRSPARRFRNNPVYDLEGMEVTVWEFESCESTSLNLFADGTLGRSYRLTETEGFALKVSPASFRE
jgi:MoaA/NifB/PqqE/SkfB family radical SAM enzyme